MKPCYTYDILFTINQHEGVKLGISPQSYGEADTMVFWTDLNLADHWVWFGNLLKTKPKDVDVNFVDSVEQTALIEAVRTIKQGDRSPFMFDVVATLIENGADLNYRPNVGDDRWMGFTALELALHLAKSEVDAPEDGGVYYWWDYGCLAPAALLLLAAGADPGTYRVRDKRLYIVISTWLEGLRQFRESCKYRFIGDIVAEFVYNESTLQKAISGVHQEDLLYDMNPDVTFRKYSQ